MAKKKLPPLDAGKPRKPSKYAPEPEEMDDEEEGCGCDMHENAMAIKIELLLPNSLRGKS
jgi:hypothetical protein